MTIVTNFLMVLEIIVSILLIVVVIAQTSKSSGMGGAVSGAADSTFGGKVLYPHSKMNYIGLEKNLQSF